MVEDASAVLAERRTGPLPPHILEGVLLEPQLFGSFCRGEKLVSSPIGHVARKKMELAGKSGKAWHLGSVELGRRSATPRGRQAPLIETGVRVTFGISAASGPRKVGRSLGTQRISVVACPGE